jgi:hypothetical protein
MDVVFFDFVRTKFDAGGKKEKRRGRHVCVGERRGMCVKEEEENVCVCVCPKGNR